MGNEYYPLSHVICHHFYNGGGCSFCGYHSQKRSVSKVQVSDDRMIEHFESFAKDALEDIRKAGRLIIAPNGSWFTEVPKRLRQHIYGFADKNGIPALEYESRASLFKPEKAYSEFSAMYHALNYDRESSRALTRDAVGELSEALGEIRPNHIVSFGLEVADDNDLQTLNKGCCLDDYVNASNHVRTIGARVGANILLSPPGVEDPIYKAFATARFGAEEMGAKEFSLMPCSPMKCTPAYEDWIQARWNPISATAASEILRVIREQYPQIRARYMDLRIFTKHGRHGKFKRKPGRWNEEEKEKVREEVRKTARRAFPTGS